MSNWLKELRSRVDAETTQFVIITGAELKELVASCGVADRRLRLLAEHGKADDSIEVKRRTVLELIRSCRFQRYVEIKQRRAGE